MKILDRIITVLFSIIILLVAIVLCITVIELLDVKLLKEAIEYVLTDEVAAKVTFGVSILAILLALKLIFFNSNSIDAGKGKTGILLQNDNGKLLVSRDTIESLTNSVVKNFAAAQNVMTRVDVDDNSNLKIFITLYVYPDAVIKEITAQIQKDIKETIKNSLDLEVKEINVRIKNIAPKEENKKSKEIKLKETKVDNENKES